jgi:farnesyl-diphosphate farnesyltransferase
MLEWLAQVDEEDRAAIRVVLAHITEGQRLDVVRFADHAGVHALASGGELRRYIYLVAGSVGEFWTDLCARKLEHFSGLAVAEMRSLGRRYGEALQLINILRDCGADLRAGRCYLPADELRAAGADPQQLPENRRGFETVFRHWRSVAAEQLQDGFSYARALRNRRLRIATALPAMIGARTLELLERAGADALNRTIKVPRKDVWTFLARLFLAAGHLK